MDIAGERGQGVGRLEARWASDDVVTLDMLPDEPRWFADRPMRTSIRYVDDAVEVRIERSDG